MNRALLSLGSNVGDRLQYLKAAKLQLEINGCKILKQSSVYETEAWGNKDQAAFYNEVIEIETELSADELMTAIINIEQSLGRIRKEKWSPRTIDIDILFFGDEIIHQDHLAVPHPHLYERRFVLVPLNEIAPDLMHPVINKTVSELLLELKDSLQVIKVAI
jgi:2-amino-4-hydroxy-6-hydroxymethyldihydropteridine diphosphokinase